MVEMDNKEWEKVLTRFQTKVDTIKELNFELAKAKELSRIYKSDCLLLDNENKDQYKERIELAKETSSLARENIALELENTKLKEEAKRDKATMSAVLEKLNDTLNMMEKHGLSTRNHKVDASDLDLIV